MSEPYIREVGRVADKEGREVIVGIGYGTVTLRTLRTRTSGAMELTGDLAEDFSQLFISACWQAAESRAWAAAAAAAGGTS